jgi:uncharacterized protein YjbI with pentapeptide repeats
VKVVKPLRVALLTRCFQYDRRDYLSVATLTLHDWSGAMTSEVDLWKQLPPLLGELGSPDAVMPKAVGEFLVTGHAHSTEATTRLSVGVQLGDVRKRIAVVGDRHLVGGRPTEPRPFTKMPLTWERAYGGPSDVANPAGRGIEPVEVEGRAVVQLPNLVWPSSEAKRGPASFAPIDFTWPHRQRKVGTYDKAWLREKYPGIALDVDWSLYNLAADDQQRAGFWGPDDPFVLDNLHPTRPRIEGRLPGGVHRCFVRRGGGLEEVPLRLTTVWFFPDIDRYLLISHGTHHVDTDDASDVTHIVVGMDDADAPRDRSAYDEELSRRLDPNGAALAALDDSNLLPAAPRFHGLADAAMAEMEALQHREGFAATYAEQRRERLQADAEARMRAAGLAPAPAPEAPPSPDPDDPVGSLEAMQAYLDEHPPPPPEAARAKLLQSFVDRGMGEEEAEAALVEAMSGPPAFRARDVLQGLRTKLRNARKSGVVLTELEAMAKDPEFVQQLEDAEAHQRRGYLAHAHFQEPVPPRDAEAIARRAAAVDAELAAGRDFRRWDLTGADLSGRDLSGADFTEAWMESCVLDRCVLDRAVFSRAVLARASLVDARGVGTRFDGANLGACSAQRLEVVDGSFVDAVVMRADLRDAVLRGSSLTSVVWSEAQVIGIDLSGADLQSSTFLDVDVSGARFVRAVLGKLPLIRCTLEDVDFSGADLRGTSFIQCEGNDLCFDDARLDGALVAMTEQWAGVRACRASMVGCNLRALALPGADFREADLSGANLGDTVLVGGRLERVKAHGAQFVGADLRGADLQWMDLMEGSLQKADLRGADVRHANLYGADLALVRTDDATLQSGTNFDQARTVPMYRPPLAPTDVVPWRGR